MRPILRIVLPFLVVGLAACTGRVGAKPGVGIGVEHRDNGGRLGLDLGEYDVGGSAVEPLTGNCPGGVCAVPSLPKNLPAVTVEAKVPPAFLWAAGLLIAAIVVYVALGGRRIK